MHPKVSTKTPAILSLCLGALLFFVVNIHETSAESEDIGIAAQHSTIAPNQATHLSPRNYSYGYWMNGFRKNPDEQSPDILSFETGYYALNLNLGDLQKASFGPLAGSNYTSGLSTHAQSPQQLPPAELLIQISSSNRIYTAKHCITGPPKDARRLRGNRLWESGRYLQHFDIQQLVFKDTDGHTLDCESRLQIVVWPESITLTAEITPKQTPWSAATTRIQFTTTENSWEARSPTIEQWEVDNTQSLTLNCELSPEEQTPVKVHTKDGQAITSTYHPAFNCQVAEVKQLKRSWKTGYTDIRDYDEFTLEIENESENVLEVPFMLYLRKVANITGLVPQLCYEDGTPTGIPVQLSKNWHSKELGSYLRAYVMLPAQPGKQHYKLRIANGFYGSLPSASHAQLSLVGYSDKGGNGRWDQLAIGCWGETICFDVDRSLVDVAVTDVRMLMARNGVDGKKWGWTNAGWGGDWLNVLNTNGQRHHPNTLKTAYFAHGPCLTDVRYNGHYGSQREIAFTAEVKTLRTDDTARTFQKFSYTFDKEVSTDGAWLFKMGRTHHYATPTFAYGNADGLIASEEVPSTLKQGDYQIEQQTIEGPAPWWVSFPGAGQTRDDGKGNGYRALVIRAYSATLGGKTYTQPSISTPLFKTNEDGSQNLDLLLTAPKGVESFKPGDTIEMDLEWITLHREADDYYGPNESYRRHLAEHPSSWKTTYREAIGNDLQVKVSGGTLRNNYPIQIQAEADTDEVTVHIQGGVGYVPIRFEGLASTTGSTLYQIVDGQSIPLDQSVHGNDFWQTDYDAATGTYSRVYNLPLDGLESSQWFLKLDE